MAGEEDCDWCIRTLVLSQKVGGRDRCFFFFYQGYVR